MYLVSIYFDKTTNRKIQYYIDKAAQKSNNTFMSDHNVPPHITISAFETKDESLAIECVEKAIIQIKKGHLQWVSIGQFLPYVLYISPVLNEYLHHISETIYHSLSKNDAISVNRFYKPFQWLPHTTIGKQLSEKEMQLAFEVMQKNFLPFEGEVIRIGLAKPNPHRDIASWDLLE